MAHRGKQTLVKKDLLLMKHICALVGPRYFGPHDQHPHVPKDYHNNFLRWSSRSAPTTTSNEERDEDRGGGAGPDAGSWMAAYRLVISQFLDKQSTPHVYRSNFSPLLSTMDPNNSKDAFPA